MRYWMLLGLLTFAPLAGCAKAPPTLSPDASVAFQKTRVLKGLDVLRDFAIDAEAATPQVLPTATTRKVVQYHQAALTIMQATDTGWVSAVGVSLDALLDQLNAADRQKLAPYVTLVKVVLAAVIR